MFHGSSNRVIVQKRRQTGEDLLTVTRYSYNRNGLVSSKSDTTITTIKGYLLTPNTIYSANFNRTDLNITLGES
jgi:hypothetical protein